MNVIIIALALFGYSMGAMLTSFVLIASMGVKRSSANALAIVWPILFIGVILFLLVVLVCYCIADVLRAVKLIK